jgi:uncharacterized protein DUF3124
MMLFRITLIFGLLILVCCSGEPSATAPPEQQSAAPTISPSSYDDLDLAAGQTIYVPVYSHVYQDRKRRPFNLVATLSVRNTDLAHPIQVTTVRYYNSKGGLIQKLLEHPISLGPLATTDFAVDEHDDGGSGTSFIVEWVAEQDVHEPVIEAVMISTALSQGLSFTSPGRVIRTLHSSAKSEEKAPAATE